MSSCSPSMHWNGGPSDPGAPSLSAIPAAVMTSPNAAGSLAACRFLRFRRQRHRRPPRRRTDRLQHAPRSRRLTRIPVVRSLTGEAHVGHRDVVGRVGIRTCQVTQSMPQLTCDRCDSVLAEHANVPNFSTRRHPNPPDRVVDSTNGSVPPWCRASALRPLPLVAAVPAARSTTLRSGRPCRPHRRAQRR